MGKITLKTDASNEFLLNLLTANNVKVFSPCGGIFSIEKGDYKVVKDLLGRHGKEITIIKDTTFSAFIKNNALRIGIYFGVILSIICLFLYSQKVTKIVISGQKYVDSKVIEGTITAITPLPASKKSIDVDEISRAVTCIDRISSSSVYLKGNVLFCTVFEELPKVDIIDKTDYTPIRSNYDAIVTRIVTFDGGAAVKSGDTVRCGDVLISPDVVIDDEKGLIAHTKPLGEVYGRVWISKEYVFYPTVCTKVRTGKTYKSTRFFANTPAKNMPFSQYEVGIERYSFGSFPIPVYVNTYYELEEREVEFDFDKNSDGIIKEATEALESELPKGCKKLDHRFEIKRLDKTVQLVIYYEIETKIN